jgi:hypothetical protein
MPFLITLPSYFLIPVRKCGSDPHFLTGIRSFGHCWSLIVKIFIIIGRPCCVGNCNSVETETVFLMTVAKLFYSTHLGPLNISENP